MAQETSFVACEVRWFVVGSHLLLLTVDEQRRTVRVIGLRHGPRLHRLRELPPDPGVFEAEEEDR